MNLQQRLTLFNDKADQLANRSFFTGLLASQASASFTLHTDGWWKASYLGPDAESIDASVLLIRQFMQDNDPISLANISKAYVDGGVTQELCAEYEAVRKQVNEYLQRPSSIGVNGGQETLTNFGILEMFVYGALAHSTPKHKNRHDSFLNTPVYPMVKLMFIDVLAKFIAGIGHLARVNSHVLQVAP